MSDLELYREIGGWIYTFHNRDHFYTRLLKDFQHDVYLKLQGKKELNREYVKITCKYYPWQLMKSTYAKRMKSHNEFVPLFEGEPVTEFADSSFNPEFEFPLPPRPKLKHHKDTKAVKVLYRNGEEEQFDSVKDLGQDLGFKDHRTLYRYIGKPLTERFTKRKMSHIQLIQYAD